MIYISTEDWNNLTELQQEGLKVQNDYEIVELNEYDQFEKDCDECEGTGVIEMADYDTYNSPATKKSECNNCSGGIVEQDYEGY